MLILFMEKAFSIIFLSEFFVVCSLFTLLVTAPAFEASQGRRWNGTYPNREATNLFTIKPLQFFKNELSLLLSLNEKLRRNEYKVTSSSD